ncbi:MAG: hypothetical protein CMA77_04905 [Euryarchaeota archaeon]|nr:hypothetical protein [Euryarchaeota archaeon]
MGEVKNFNFCGEIITPGTRLDTALPIGSDPMGQSAEIPIQILHGTKTGPIISVIGAIHGDELNGTGIIHHLVYGDDHRPGTSDDHIDPNKLSGTVLLVPVANVDAMMMNSRTSPDGRDLNRVFPGTADGSQTSRLAHAIFTHIVKKSDYLIDLHTAPYTRMNVPQIRADLENSKCKRIARAFGTKVIMNSKGPKGSIRREATKVGVPAILLESGSSHRFEKDAVEGGVKGILNVLAKLKMIEREVEKPNWRILVRKFRWVRSPVGGILHTLVPGGAVVKEGEVIAYVTDPFGARVDDVISPVNGYIVGLATTPLVRPGDPIANIVFVREKKLHEIISKEKMDEGSYDDITEQDIEDDEGSTLDETER